MEDFDAFLSCFRCLLNENNVNQANDQLKQWKSNNILLYLTQTARIILFYFTLQKQESQDTQQIDPNIVILALIAIKDSCTPRKTERIEQIREIWISTNKEATVMRETVRSAISQSIFHSYEPIRCLACASLSYVLQIEGTNWISIIPQIINNPIPSDPLNIISIFAFWEIFELHVIPFHIHFTSLDKNDYMKLVTNIFNIATNQDDSIGSNIKEKSFQCLKHMILILGPEFFNPELTHTIFEVIVKVLSTSKTLTVNLYRDIHWVLIQLIKTLYEYAPSFSDHIFFITDTGIKSESPDFNIISYHFWSQVWSFEKKYLNQMKQERGQQVTIQTYGEITSTDRPETRETLVAHYSSQLFEQGCYLLLKINPSSTINYFDSECSFVDYIITTLTSVFDSILYDSKTALILPQIFDRINSFLENSKVEDKVRNDYLAINLMNALMFNHQNLEIFDFVQNKLPCIFEFSQLPVFPVQTFSIQLITNFLHFSNQNVFTNPDNFEMLSKTIQVLSELSPQLSSKALFIIQVISEQSSKNFLDHHFEFFLSILEKKFSDIEFRQSEYSRFLYLALMSLFQYSGDNSFDQMMNYFQQSIDLYKKSFDSQIFVSEMDQTWFLDPFFSIIDRIQSTNCSIAILQKRNQAKPIVAELLDILMKTKNTSANIFEQSIDLISRITILPVEQFLPYVPEYTQSLKNGLFSQNPDLIQHSARAFGRLCLLVGGNYDQEYPSDFVSNLFQLMTSLEDYQQIQVLAQLLFAFHDIVEGLKTFIPFAFIEQLFQYAITLIHFNLDMSNYTEKLFGDNLFSALCNLFAIILPLCPDEFLAHRNFKKTILFKEFRLLFARINNQNFENSYLLNTPLELIKTIIEIIGRNRQLKCWNIFFHYPEITAFLSTLFVPTRSDIHEKQQTDAAKVIATINQI